MSLSVETKVESWPLREPFEIAREVLSDLPLLVVTVTDEHGHRGWAEAAGVDYDGDTPESMAAAIHSVGADIHIGIDQATLRGLLPSAGARNAVDCALWDLRAKCSGVPVWSAAGLSVLRSVATAMTIGLGSPEDIQRQARAYAHLPLIKVKVDAHRHIDIVRIVRREAPNARLLVDANESWSSGLLIALLPEFLAEGVELIEQPLPRGKDEALADIRSPLPLVADESCTDRESLAELVGRYQGVNIKLDKGGGLTEGLATARAARALGLDVMVGNMCGTSLGMAPAFLVAQLARWADLDGPLLQQGDREHAMRYDNGTVQAPASALWG
jgi:L-alanine-DL-glutamate epimerase-like enolase superfamily enzyme